MREYLAFALQNCQIVNVHIWFSLCNLSDDSVQLLANALQRNTTLGAFTCTENPLNFSNGRNYDSKTEEILRQAIINTKAPIKQWNCKPLPRDVIEARNLLVAAATLNSIPSAEKLIAIDRTVSETRVKLTHMQAKLNADMKERYELTARIELHDRELTQMKHNLHKLDLQIAQEQHDMEQFRAVLAENEKLQREVEFLKARLGYLFMPTQQDDSALCQICMEHCKNRTFYRCGHQVCSKCADSIMQRTRKCPYCKQNIWDVITTY